jgi:TolB-like protein/DNA-binding winged helix-turn-helix (wHTH) protein/Tfp pilus assembly protein PilF
MAVPGREDSRLAFGVFAVDVEAGELRKHGTRIRLQDRPFQLLVALLNRPGEVVTREELRERLWPDGTFVDFDHNLSSAVNKLRTALDDSAQHPRYIETVGRRGYRFLYPISVGTPASAPLIPGSRTARSRRRLLVLLSLGLLVSAVALLLALGRGAAPPAADRATVRSIAVLPLRNLSSDAQQEYFSEGLTDELIARLAAVEGLRVISRSSAMRYKDSRKPLPVIAKELNVDAVLEGSVLRAEGKVRITARLIEAATDRHVWARSYERDHRDILDLQNDVARDIADSIRLKVGPTVIKRPLNPEAHQAYLLARYRWYTRREDELLRALADFQRAISLDPGYALAHAGLADVYVVSPLLTPTTQEEAYPKAQQAAERALALDPTLAEAHNSSAYVKMYLNWDFAAAELGFRKAIELKPGYATAHQWYSELLAFLGRHAEAIAEIRKALELDPLSAVMHHQAGQTYQQARQYDQAIVEYRNAIVLLPEFGAPNMFMSLAFRRTGRLTQAAEAMKAAFPNEGLWTSQLATAAGRGDMDAYVRKEQEIAGRLPRPAYYFALYEAALGNDAGAFRWLDEAYTRRDECLLYLGVDPEWDRLRSDPRFRAIVQKVGLMPTSRPRRPDDL